MIYGKDLEDALAAFAKNHSLDRDKAIEHVIRAALINNGYLSSGEEGIRPQRLNATNDD